MFYLHEFQNHGKLKYQILHPNGKHIAYLNNKQEAESLIKYLNKE